MRAQVSKWGNSLAIRLPKAVAASLDVKAGEAVELTIEGSAVVIRSRRPKYSIEELVAAMRTEAEPESFDDVNTPPVGQELLAQKDAVFMQILMTVRILQNPR